MKGIVTAVLLLALSGCSAIKLNPASSGEVGFRTPIEGVTAQLILSQDFQRKVLTQKPSYGKAWGPREFEIAVGRPLSQAIAADTKSRILSSRIGDRADGKPSTVTITPQTISLEFGVDDGRAMGFMAGFGILAAGSDAVVGAKATLKALVAVNDGAPALIEVVGASALKLTYLSINESDVNKVVGLALDDAAEKLGDAVANKTSAALN